MRKYHKQMKKAEIKAIISRLSKFKYGNRNKISEHARERMEQRKISEYDLYNVFKRYKIIEFENKEGDIRALIRGYSTTSKNKNICLCISLTSGNIITCFDTNEWDNHSTLNKKMYNEKLDIKSFINFYKVKY